MPRSSRSPYSSGVPRCGQCKPTSPRRPFKSRNRTSSSSRTFTALGMSWSSSAALTASQYFRSHSPAGVPGPTRGMSASETCFNFLALLVFIESISSRSAQAVFFPALEHRRAHLVGRLGDLPAESLLDRAVGHHLRGDAVFRRRRLEAARDRARDDEHIGRRLKARRHRPETLVWVVDVDILVDDDHMLPLAAPRVERRGEQIIDEAGPDEAFFHLKHEHDRDAPRRRVGFLQDGIRRLELLVGGDAVGERVDVKVLVRRLAEPDIMVDWIFPVRDRLDRHDALVRHHLRRAAAEFTERPLVEFCGYTTQM